MVGKNILILLILGIMLLSGCTQSQDVIKVGAVLPLTGEGTIDQGQASQNALILAVDEINAKGGINGKKVEAIIEDSQCQASTGVTAITKLIEVDNVDFIIGDICDSVTAAIMPIAEQKGVVLITPGSTSPDISEAGDYVFRFWFSETDLGGIVAEDALNSGYNNLTILYINNAWGVAQKNGVKNRLEELGGNVVSEQAIDPSETDYHTIILKAEQESPDAYYVGLHPAGLVLAAKQLQDFNISKQIYSHGGLVGSTQTLGLGGDYLEGIIAPFVYKSSSDFVEKFKMKFGSEPGITADSSYDAATVVFSIMAENDEVSSALIKDGLYEVKDYIGASGLISVDSKGDVHRSLQPMIVKDGELIVKD